ncbi:hypothetical protein [Cupriavidus pauculus]|uniref:hypothetical protein n=1 Tax=Cupriavidus pauculus TaxID=82633 RepID=UPI001EE37A43|nr:hypothetical protein [Cupriavidus pauculus]GJG96802.1 hypothetical protein CBA19C6_19955 [Cupriavidus pauculus]
MSKIYKNRKDGTTFDLEYPSPLPEIYVDGISQAIIGAPVSKLVFHSITPQTEEQIEEGVESRTVATQIAIPTHQLLSMCQMIVHALKANEQSLTVHYEKLTSQVKEVLNSTQVSPK